MNAEQAEKRTILKILAGSHVHGLNVQTSDRDEEGIVIERIEDAFGLGNPWEDTVSESPERDVKYVSLRKWCRLACKGNPNFLLPLFAPASHVLALTAIGGHIREMRDKFISKQVIKSHLGYMQGQRSRLVNHQNEFGGGGGRGKPRFELIEKHGYDTKFAMHLIRLAKQGLELAREGTLTLPMDEFDRGICLSIRRGEWGYDSVLWQANHLEGELKRELEKTNLPDEPDYTAVEEWMLDTYAEWWKCDTYEKDRIKMSKQFPALKRAGLRAVVDP